MEKLFQLKKKINSYNLATSVYIKNLLYTAISRATYSLTIGLYFKCNAACNDIANYLDLPYEIIEIS